jgi:hypothetical protein
MRPPPKTAKRNLVGVCVAWLPQQLPDKEHGLLMQKKLLSCENALNSMLPANMRYFEQKGIIGKKRLACLLRGQANCFIS